MPKTTESKLVKTLPAKERCFVQRITPAGFVFYTTGKQDRSQYSLWLETEGGFLLVKKAKEPLDFEEIAMNWGEKLKVKREKAVPPDQS